ncbi:MAG: stage II sporulation protein M [Clostridia bacterium]|nr:stage II sporulation protein M [Clostridia bacterium]
MKENLRYYFKNNIKEYIIISIIFLIGIIIGVMVINNSGEEQSEEVRGYVESIIKNVKEEDNIDSNEVFLKKVKSNLSFILLCGVLGSTIIGIPVLLILIGYKGFSLGYTISSIMASSSEINKGIWFSICSLLLQNIFFILAIFIIGVSGINLCKYIISRDKRENIKFEIIKYIFFLLIASCLVIIASLAEGYISVNLIKIFKKNF